MIHSALLVFHRWLGLVTALFILVIALSGSGLVFENGIDRLQHPDLWRAEGDGSPLSLDTIASRASNAARGEAVIRLTLPDEPRRAIVATTGRAQVFLDPYSGAVLGQRSLSESNASLARRLHRLHVALLRDDRGSTVVALMTIAALFLTATGVFVWWKERRWRVQWGASWKRVWFDLHHSLGLGASLVLLVVTASGLVIHYDTLSRLIRSADTAPQAVAGAQPPSTGNDGVVGFDSVAKVAKRALPDASITVIARAAANDQPVLVSMRFPGDRTPAGRSRVHIDRFRGAIIGLQSTRAAGRGTRVNNVMRSLHTGDIYGAPTRAIWSLCALILAWQALSGFVMWWNGRRSRTAAARRDSAPAERLSSARSPQGR